MMDRLDKIQDHLIRFRVIWMEQKIETCKRQPDLREQAEKVLLKLKNEQARGHGLDFCYLVLFHFRSSLWTGTYQYQIHAVDEALYLNPPFAVGHWIPRAVYNDVEALRGALKKELGKKFIRLQPYEIEFAVRAVMEDYQKLAEVCWKQEADELISGETFQSLQKNCNWKILSGTYMDDIRIIIQSEDRR